MRKLYLLGFSVAALITAPALAQHEHEHGSSSGSTGWGGHFASGPPHGPAPVRVPPPPPARPVAPPRPVAPAHPVAPPPRVERGERPHVEHDGKWVGHERGREDDRYKFGRPWQHGRFTGPIGAGHVYRIGGWEAPAHRFWFGSSYFLVSPNDWDYVDDWNWSADQVVIYDDPDHEGWYLAYNPRLGTYVHVEYDGALQQ